MASAPEDKSTFANSDIRHNEQAPQAAPFTDNSFFKVGGETRQKQLDAINAVSPTQPFDPRNSFFQSNEPCSDNQHLLTEAGGFLPHPFASECLSKGPQRRWEKSRVTDTLPSPPAVISSSFFENSQVLRDNLNHQPNIPPVSSSFLQLPSAPLVNSSTGRQNWVEHYNNYDASLLLTL
ncbi:hypothetical protein CPB83DRAFT_900976 [Crepidotus variabilis]|uniref:Uncharacterized protein n=1 Tax=Crepidotus variabilis TaxID=179855 RepID=A0A9P6BBT6_9AGAR|nr:hypothetical protein CPB83DRAFT_900976 [Crepidotus variabilis]